MLKEDAEKLMKIKGRTKGSEILTLVKYIKEYYGEKGIKELEVKMAEIGYPIVFQKIKIADWYPESLNVLAMLLAKEIFGWKDLFDLGYRSPVLSFGVKIFVKFLPLPLFLKQIPKIWRKFLDVGELEAFLCPNEKNCAIIRQKNYKFHPDMCSYFVGFFQKMGELVINPKKIFVIETKCIFKRDPYHQYEVRWE